MDNNTIIRAAIVRTHTISSSSSDAPIEKVCDKYLVFYILIDFSVLHSSLLIVKANS